MNKNNLANAFIFTGTDYIINDQHPYYEQIKEVTFKVTDDIKPIDLAYEITAKAFEAIASHYACSPDKEPDTYEIAEGAASMYTQDRLSYINIGNEEEIMDIIRDNGATSISEAAEYWYDQKVANVIDMIISRFSK